VLDPSDDDPGEVQRRRDEATRHVAQRIEDLVAIRRAQIDGERRTRSARDRDEEYERRSRAKRTR